MGVLCNSVDDRVSEDSSQVSACMRRIPDMAGGFLIMFVDGGVDQQVCVVVDEKVLVVGIIKVIRGATFIETEDCSFCLIFVLA